MTENYEARVFENKGEGSDAASTFMGVVYETGGSNVQANWSRLCMTTLYRDRDSALAAARDLCRRLEAGHKFVRGAPRPPGTNAGAQLGHCAGTVGRLP